MAGKMERTLVSLASFLVLFSAPAGAEGGNFPSQDPLITSIQLKTESCGAPETPFKWMYNDREFETASGAVEYDGFPVEEDLYAEEKSAGVDPFDTGGPYELVYSGRVGKGWEKEYYYAEFETLPPYDVPVVVNDSVESFIRYFQTRGRRSFEKWLERSAAYLPLVKRILRQVGMPEDLAYLALIESGFNPLAKSRKKAVGIWQFMHWTGKNYGLRVDWWIDERRDPEKATMAAASYLKNLHERFDSWYLAAAGYNGGEGRIIRALKKYGTEDFWELASRRRALKKETKNYIPKYLAAMIIAKNPEKYGFYKLDYLGPLAYDRVKVAEATDLKVLAKAAGTTVKELKRLNPELNGWFTPPDYPDYELKIPPGSSGSTPTGSKRATPFGTSQESTGPPSGKSCI
jgi:hypothetical protein